MTTSGWRRQRRFEATQGLQITRAVGTVVVPGAVFIAGQCRADPGRPSWSVMRLRPAPRGFGVICAMADGVKVPQYLAVASSQGVLAIGQAVLGAKSTHDSLSPAQVAAGHRREKVVLDLEVQAAHEEGDDAPPDTLRLVTIWRCANGVLSSAASTGMPV